MRKQFTLTYDQLKNQLSFLLKRWREENAMAIAALPGKVEAPPAINPAKVLVSLGEIRKVAADLNDRIARLEEVVANGQTSTRALVTEFRATWERKTQDRYVPNDAGDGAVMRRLLKMLSAVEIRARWMRYFQLDEEFVRTNRYSMTLFGTTAMINRLGGHAAPAGRETSAARQMHSDLHAAGFLHRDP